MSDLGFNKIAFCVLGTGLAVIGLNELSHSFFHHSTHEFPGYYIEAEEAGAGDAQVAEGPVDYGRLLLAADIAKGAEQHKKCLQCHNFDQGGPDNQGPNLYGVLGRDIASHGTFKYSTGPGSLSEMEGAWDYEKLDHFITRPKGMASNTLMNFAGINSRITGQVDRINLIAFLRSNGSENVPLPAPLPDTPAAPADGVTPPADGTAPVAPADGGAAPAPAEPATPPVPTAPTPAPAPH